MTRSNASRAYAAFPPLDRDEICTPTRLRKQRRLRASAFTEPSAQPPPGKWCRKAHAKHRFCNFYEAPNITVLINRWPVPAQPFARFQTHFAVSQTRAGCFSASRCSEKSWKTCSLWVQFSKLFFSSLIWQSPERNSPDDAISLFTRKRTIGKRFKFIRMLSFPYCFKKIWHFYRGDTRLLNSMYMGRWKTIVN